MMFEDMASYPLQLTSHCSVSTCPIFHAAWKDPSHSLQTQVLCSTKCPLSSHQRI